MQGAGTRRYRRRWSRVKQLNIRSTALEGLKQTYKLID